MVSKGAGAGSAGSVNRSIPLMNHPMGRRTLDVVKRYWKYICVVILFYYGLVKIFGWIFTIVITLCAIVVIARYIQRKLIFQNDEPPNSRTAVPNPSIIQCPYEEVLLESHGNKLHGYLLKHPNAMGSGIKPPTLLFFHGNAGNIGHRIPSVGHLMSNYQCNVFLAEYRGYGISTGTPSESACVEDAKVFLDHLCDDTREDIDPSKIVIMGRSLGGAVAIRLATECGERAKALVVENTFTSMLSMAHRLLSFTKHGPSFMLFHPFENDSHVKKVTIPTLFLSGSKDELIPPSDMDTLFDLCGAKQKKMVRFSEGEHNTTWMCDGYGDSLARFLADVSDEESDEVPRIESQ